MINAESKLSGMTITQMLYDLERNVTGNAAKAYATRSVIEENRALALRNYAAAFLGDRHLAQQNTDDLIHARIALLQANVEKAEDLKNLSADARMQFLEHKNAMNVTIGEISQRLIDINGSLQEVNRTIDNLNVQITTFNSKQLVENERILGGGEVDSESKTAQQDYAAQLMTTAQTLLKDAQKYDATLSKLLQGAADNRTMLNQAYEVSMENRDLIIENRDSLTSQQSSVLDAVAKTEERLA